MSASAQDKTEDATPKRRREARERGQVPRSRELTTAAVMLGGGALMVGLGSSIAGGAQQFMRSSLQIAPESLQRTADLPSHLGLALGHGLWIVTPLLGGLLLIAAAASVLIGGWNFSSQSLMPDLKRLNPISGLGRMFSSHGWVELGKGLAKFALIGAVAGLCGWKLRGELMGLGAEAVNQGIAHGASLCLQAFLWLGGALLLIAALDVPWQIWSYNKQLRMTKQEVRDEYKQSEGRPEVKARIRRVQQEMSRRRMMEEVPTADVIVTNPTHYAVALKYDSNKSRAPRVVAKGVDQIALSIRELAGQHRIPIVEAPPLARALYRNCELEAEIPVNLYSAVAQVLTYVYQLRAYRGGPTPVPPRIEQVPGGEEKPVPKH